MSAIHFLFGKIKIKADYAEITEILNICMQHRIAYSDFKAEIEGVSLCFTSKNFNRLKSLTAQKKVSYDVCEIRGIPSIFERYKYRYGIILGVVLATIIVAASQMFVWSIDITGNTNLTSAEIIALLKREGFGIGSYIQNANTDRIENEIMINTDLISWMSINIIGTHAQVQIREYEKASGDIEGSVVAANLVAAKSGIIEDVRIYKGNVVVSAGTFVEKGDLLVSGLYDSDRVGFRYTRASGEVMARTTNEFLIEIPYEYVEYEYTGEQYYEKYLNFFDFSINILKNSGKEGMFYDKIDTVEDYCLFGVVATPFSLHTVRYSAISERTAYRTQAEAEELAYFELSRRLSEMADDSIILRKTIIPSINGDSFSIFCTVVAIENIAKTSEFEVDINMLNEGT